jgi:hypothetical protein
MIRRSVKNEWENIWREAVVAQPEVLPRNLAAGTEKTMKNGSQESRCVDRHSNHTLPTCQPTCSAGVNIWTVPDTVLFGNFGLII